MDNSEEIYDENDQDSLCGYYLRSKRRKHKEKCSVEEDTHAKPTETLKRKNPIMHVPTEVIQNVFKYVSYHELSTQVRLVNRRFKVIAENMLNIAFKNLKPKIEALVKSTYMTLQSSEDDSETKYVCKLLNMLEILNVQYSVIMSTLWRYVYNHNYRTPSGCMYAGLIIDAHREFIRTFTQHPFQLYSVAVLRDYAMPVNLTKIIQLTKSFCVHFDKVTEEPLSNSLIYSGCKVIDILDCALFAQKTTIFEYANDTDMFTAKYCYYFNNSWFIALPITQTKTMSWRQKQRMMHMRLKRIVLAHTDMYLQQAQYEREVMLRTQATTRPKKPGNNVYTGYGDVEDTFFYYGVMNDGAYIQKFHLDDDNDEENNEDELQEVQGNNLNIDVALDPSDEDILYRIPHLGMRVDVKVKCPLVFAPLKYIERMNNDQIRLMRHRGKQKGPTNINMVFECYGAHYPRLPTTFEYIFNPLK